MSSAERKGKTRPLEAGRGKYSPGPGKGHFGGIEAKKQRSHVLKFRFPIKSDTYKYISIKTQETPEISHNIWGSWVIRLRGGLEMEGQVLQYNIL